MAKTKQTLTPEEARRRIMVRWKDKTQVTPATLELVRSACAEGATVGNICAVLGISERQFYRWMDNSPEFARTVKAGRSIEHDRLVNKLVQVALSGNVAALCFALKTRHNYVDSGVGAVVENKVAITFQLPEAMKPEQYLKTLTATAEVIRPDEAARALAKPGVRVKVLKQLAGEASDGQE